MDGMVGYGEALLRMVLALAVISAGAYLVIRFGLKRWMRPVIGGEAIFIIDRVPLSLKQSLWVVRVGSRYFLLGGTEHSVHLVSELREEDVAQRLNVNPVSDKFPEKEVTSNDASR